MLVTDWELELDSTVIGRKDISADIAHLQKVIIGVPGLLSEPVIQIAIQVFFWHLFFEHGCPLITLRDFRFDQFKLLAVTAVCQD